MIQPKEGKQGRIYDAQRHDYIAAIFFLENAPKAESLTFILNLRFCLV